jgi:hypothetical protein
MNLLFRRQGEHLLLSVLTDAEGELEHHLQLACDLLYRLEVFVCFHRTNLLYFCTK